MIVIDTNALSALMQAQPNVTVRSWLDRQPSTSIWTTAITVLEIRFGIEILAAGRRRVALLRDLSRIVSDDMDGRVLAFGEADAEQTAILMGERRSSGRTGDSATA